MERRRETSRLSASQRLSGLALVLLLCAPLAGEAEASEAAPPPAEAVHLLNEAYRLKAARNFDGAMAAFEAARKAGADAQRVSLELGYCAAAKGDVEAT